VGAKKIILAQRKKICYHCINTSCFLYNQFLLQPNTLYTMTKSFPSNFENYSDNHSDSRTALEAKILGLRAVIQYLKEQKSSPEEIEMKKEELDELEAQHHDLVYGDDDVIVHGDDDAIESYPDDEGDAPQSGLSTGDLERKVAEMQSRMDKQSQTKPKTYLTKEQNPLKQLSLMGAGLSATMLTGITAINNLPKQPVQQISQVENSSTAPNPEQRQAPALSGVENPSTAASPDQRQTPTISSVENSAEQINIPINIDYRSLDGNIKTMNVGNVVSTTGDQKLAYKKMLAGKGCVILGGQIINGEPSIQIVVLGGMQLEFFTEFEDGGNSILSLNYTSKLPEHNIYVYTFHEKPLKTTPMLFSDGSRNLFLKNNSTITIQTPLEGVRVPLASMQYGSPVAGQTPAHP
jgi:hypothetical protein